MEKLLHCTYSGHGVFWQGCGWKWEHDVSIVFANVIAKNLGVFHSTYYLHFRVQAETKWSCLLVARGPLWSLRPDHNDRGIEAESHWRDQDSLCECEERGYSVFL